VTSRTIDQARDVHEIAASAATAATRVPAHITRPLW
jgi:hypothetical protein